MKKSIGFLIPCYNEEENVQDMAESLLKIADEQLADYECTITFIDNCSHDKTRKILQKICEREKRVRAIFNAKNFGAINAYYGLLQLDTDCEITMPCDFQIPLDIIPAAVQKWEGGKKIVGFVKGKTEEKGIKRMFRKLYYAILTRFSDTEQIPHFTGAGLYDKSFIDICKKLDDPVPSMRGNVAEFGYDVELLPYTEKLRKKGKSKNNFFTLFDLAMRNFVSYTNFIPRFATFFGMIISAISFAIGIIYFILKLVYWNTFAAGVAPLIIGVFFMGGIQLFFLGLLGEYLLNINRRLKNRPLVVEEKRLNW